jgi:hypothetical protein
MGKWESSNLFFWENWNLALDNKLNDGSIIDSLTKKKHKKGFTPCGESLEELEHLQVSKTSVICQASKILWKNINRINPYLTLSTLPIGIEKPVVRAKGINHPKVRSRGDLLPCSSASLLYPRQP